MYLRLPTPHFTAADVWTALPPSRREAAQDYCVQERLSLCVKRGSQLLGRVEGYQDIRYPHAAPAEPGWQVDCTCERQMPCAHVGALLLTFAKRPEQFRLWTEFLASIGDDLEQAVWEWASGHPFPWGHVTSQVPWYLRAPENVSTVVPLAFEGLDRSGARQQHHTLQQWIRSLHPAWWADEIFMAHLRDRLKYLARGPVTPEDWVAWIAVLSRQPECPLYLLIRAPSPPHLAVDAAFLRELWTLLTAEELSPRPSHRIAALALLETYADWLDRHGRGEEALHLWDQFSFADATGIHRAEWLARSGRLFERTPP